MITNIPPFDPRELRNVFGCFGTGVTVVTSGSPGGRPVGVTANSFSSVSLDPPIGSWNLGIQSPSLAAFDEAGRFVINVLSSAQVQLSRQFSSKLVDKFVGVAYHEGIAGIAVLDDCVATIECKTIQRLEVGDHVLFLGQVEQCAYQRAEPLLFCQGQYVQLASELTGSPGK